MHPLIPVRCSFVLLLLAALPSSAAPQDTPATWRLRVTTLAPEVRVLIGEHRARTADSLYIAAGGTLTPVALAEIARVERSAGRRLSLAGGMGGAVAGVVAGGLVACAANRDSYGVFCGGQDDTKVAVGAVLGGIAGGALGALLFGRERWILLAPGEYGPR